MEAKEKTATSISGLLSRKRVLLFAAPFFVFLIAVCAVFILSREDRAFLPKLRHAFEKINGKKYDDVAGLPEIADETQENRINMEVYANTTYGYTLTYPKDHFLSPSSVEAAWTPVTIKNTSIERGGSVFISNYADIERYSDTEHPEDFYVIGLSVYRAKDITVDLFATLFGFLENDEVHHVNDFTGGNIIGKEYITTATGSGSRAMIVFQQGDVFYVLQPAFIADRIAVVELFEKVARSFALVE